MCAMIYVSPSGADDNPGTLEKPYKTVLMGLSSARAGDTVFLREGTYRERVDLHSGAGAVGSPIRLTSYQGERANMRGSDVVTGWENHSGSIWKKSAWEVNSQQVFVDFDLEHKLPLKQIGMPAYNYTSFYYPNPIGTDLSSMFAGSFFYDKVDKTLYVWLPDGSDPNQHVMEVSTRSRILFLGGSHYSISEIDFYHSSIGSQQGSSVELGSDSEIYNCNIQYMDFTGLGLGYLKSNTRAYDCDISYNGNSGINAPGTRNFSVFGVKMYGNNYRDFNPLWHAGGFKAAADAYGSVESCDVAYNRGSGIWFDYCNGGQPIVIKDNYIHDNGPKEAAIFLEVSKNCKVFDNKIVNNERRGIYIAASDHVEAKNNTVTGVKGYSAIEIDGMPRSGATLISNTLRQNTIEKCTSGYDLVITPPLTDGTISGNSSDLNSFSRDDGEPVFMYDKVVKGLDEWRKISGQDMNSTSTGTKPPPVEEPPEEKPPVEEPVPEIPTDTFPDIHAGVAVIQDLVEGATYTGVVNLAIIVTSQYRINSTALYINSVLVKREPGSVLDYEWDTTKLDKKRSYQFYISAIDEKNQLSKKNIRVYIK